MKSNEGLRRLLTLTGWRQFFKIISKKEKIVFFILFVLFLSSSVFLSVNFYYKNTEIKPAFGGEYSEGEIGQPSLINPIYSGSSDVDRDLIELIFSGLMKYDSQGKIVPDLAKEEPKILEEGKVYEFYLRENLYWSDGEKLTADDIIFTVKTIQNSDYKSSLRANWLGVEVEKISDTALRFKLKNPYFPFLERTTLKIIPKHIWEDIPPQNFPLAIYNNLRPVGSGPYKLEKLEQDESGYIKSLALIPNPHYFGKKPNIQKINFLFFEKEEELIKAFKEGKIKGLSLNNLANFTDFTNIANSPEIHSFSLPRYFAVFFNPDKSKIFSEKEVRKALNYATNKKEIVEKISEKGPLAEAVDSPILPEIYGFNPPSKIYEFNVETAKRILDQAGFLADENGKNRGKIIKKESAFQFKSDLKLGSQGTEVEKLQECLKSSAIGGSEIYPEGKITGIFEKETKEAVSRFQKKYVEGVQGTGVVGSKTRAKLNELCFPPSEEKLALKFSLTTVDQPVLKEVASLLKKQWGELGIEVEIKTLTIDISQFENEIIKPREYEALLFGEALGMLPDPFPFWHSLQKKDPGLNLAIYENKECDKLLEEARQDFNEAERKEKLEKFQNLLIEDAPVVFLYNPDYIYLVSKEIKGINVKMITDPSERFAGIEDWYLKMKRIFK